LVSGSQSDQVLSLSCEYLYLISISFKSTFGITSISVILKTLNINGDIINFFSFANIDIEPLDRYSSFLSIDPFNSYFNNLIDPVVDDPSLTHFISILRS